MIVEQYKLPNKCNCLDNTVMERFFRSLKTERLNHLSFIVYRLSFIVYRLSFIVYRLSFINYQSVIYESEDYIQFYNYFRCHSRIGYLTPHPKYHELKNTA